jgi:CubicO group peptidase (beta-lactamase class C family)
MDRIVAVAFLVSSLAGCADCGRRGASTSRAPPAAVVGDGSVDAALLDEGPGRRSRAERARVGAQVPAIGWARFDRDRQLEGAVGRADVERELPASTETLFQVASIAKPIIATAVMQLVEARRLTLDEDISAAIGFAPALREGTSITLRQLLTHTSSLGDLPESAARSDEPLAVFLHQYFARAKGGPHPFLEAGPGTTMRYSNVGFCLAALAVEHASGLAFFEQVRRTIFEPLGMRHARFRPAPATSKEALAEPYAAGASGFLHLRPPVHALYPVVDLFATPRDLARFGRAILRGGELEGKRILRPENVDEMLRIPFDAAPTDALGWQARTLGHRRVLGHEGEDEGASTGFYLDRASGVGAIVLANGDAFQSGSAVRAAAISDFLGALLSVTDD